jgi:hypothetical protein
VVPDEGSYFRFPVIHSLQKVLLPLNLKKFIIFHEQNPVDLVKLSVFSTSVKLIDLLYIFYIK